MSVIRINEFRARDGQSDALHDFLKSVVTAVESFEGCESCQLLQGYEDPAQFVVIETWESVEAHQASVKDIPPGMFDEVMKLLAAAPTGAYYRKDT